MIELVNVSKSFDGGTSYGVEEVSFNWQPDEILVILGFSGSGKTSLCRMIRGLETPTKGEIILNGAPLSSISSKKLAQLFGYVSQTGGLFPHLNVEKNLSIATNNSIPDLLKLVNLPYETYKKRYPHQLSGGEKQRVAVARALANHPPYLIMDEPFASLDVISRSHLQKELLSLKAKLNSSILFITHDLFEALYLADRIAIFNEGKLEKIGTKKEVFSVPTTPFITNLAKQLSEQIAEISQFLAFDICSLCF